MNIILQARSNTVFILPASDNTVFIMPVISKWQQITNPAGQLQNCISSCQSVAVGNKLLILYASQ
jgi:hypothetical protein